MSKNQHTPSSKIKNRCAISSMNKISFMRRKINIQVSRTKITTQWVPWTKSVSCGENSMQKFHEEKIQHSTCFTDKNQHSTSWTKKKNQYATSSIAKMSFTRQKSMYKIQEEKNQHATCLTKRKTNMQQVPRTKISTEWVPYTKSVSRGEKINVKV